jgi:predicted MFS family arabinose efflux permease
MYSRKLKNGYFILEGLNSFGTVFYFYYFYFFMQKEFGYGNKANLLLAALNGLAYALGSWWAGKLAARTGYLNALKIGFGTMAAALLIGSQLHSAPTHIMVMVLNVFGMCFTWPVLEALVSEGEAPHRVPHMVGLYNVIWAATGAVAYFIGGATFELLGLRAMFYVPLGVAIVQLAVTQWLQALARQEHTTPGASAVHPVLPDRPSPARARTFLRMAWLANPFAYIAINTVVAVMPGVARRLELSTMEAGFICSVWLFARVAAFAVLWVWPGWHYRFSWLWTSFAALVLSFAAILMAPGLPLLVAAQLLFGGAIGLLYYSSLYYSMDVSETKSEHGGIHEAVIGLGNFAGPAVGAMSLHFLPSYSNSGAVSVSLLLLCGFGGLMVIWASAKPR